MTLPEKIHLLNFIGVQIYRGNKAEPATYNAPTPITPLFQSPISTNTSYTHTLHPKTLLPTPTTPPMPTPPILHLNTPLAHAPTPLTLYYDKHSPNIPLFPHPHPTSIKTHPSTSPSYKRPPLYSLHSLGPRFARALVAPL